MEGTRAGGAGSERARIARWYAGRVVPGEARTADADGALLVVDEERRQVVGVEPGLLDLPGEERTRLPDLVARWQRRLSDLGAPTEYAVRLDVLVNRGIGTGSPEELAALEQELRATCPGLRVDLVDDAGLGDRLIAAAPAEAGVLEFGPVDRFGYESPLWPGTTVLGRFVSGMLERIASASDDEERAILEEALQLGVQAMRGRLVAA